MVGRHLRNPSFAVSSTELNNIYGTGRQSLYQLSIYNDGVSKNLVTYNAANDIYKNRENFKQYVWNELSANHPMMVPALYDMSTNLSATGHFYLIVGVYLTSSTSSNYGGIGSVVAVKDVWTNNNGNLSSSRTMYYDYVQMLNSMWYAYQKSAGVGSEFYAVLSFQ